MLDKDPLKKTDDEDTSRKPDSLSYLAKKLIKLGNNKDLRQLWNPINWDHKQFICGWSSAFINICITYPINKVIFRQVCKLLQ